MSEERHKRTATGKGEVRVLGYELGYYQAFCPVFHFLTFCSLALCPMAFCPVFDLVYTAEIRGQPLVI